MDKLVFNDSFDYGEEIPLVSIADNPDDMRKCASSQVIDQWGDIKPIKGHSLVHLVALGDYESTGSNRNGDAFESGFCKQSHPTFVTHGNLYRNHKAIPGKEEGYVVKTAHNDNMGRVELLVAASHDKCADWLADLEKGRKVAFSMGLKCLIPGVKIHTNRGLIAIEDVEEGDFVLTHTGTYREVLETISSPTGGRKTVTAKTQGNPTPIQVTDDHPVWCVRRENVRRISGNHLKANPSWIPEYVRADSLSAGDYLVKPVRKLTGTLDIDPDTAYLLGQYLGDGCVSNDKNKNRPNVSIITHEDDVDIWGKIVKICTKKKINYSMTYHNAPSQEQFRKKRAVSVRVRSLDFVNLCKRYCGVTSGKYVSDELFNLSREAALAFIGGYIDADGSLDKKKGSIRTCSVLDSIALGIHELCISCGLIPSVNRDWFGVRPSGGGFNNSRQFAYVMFIPASDAGTLKGYSVKADNVIEKSFVRSCQCVKFEYEGASYVACPIKYVKIEDSTTDTVFCLNVDQDHSFVAEGVVVHNCDYDVCSICSKKSSKRSEYCEHVKKNASAPYGMGKVLPDGRKCFVFNPSGVWNDISQVPVGADQIAFDLRKVASLDPDSAIGGAELAEMYYSKTGSADLGKIALARKLSAMEKRVEAIGLGQGITRVRRMNKVASDALRSAPVSEMFCELSKIGAVLPVREFFQLVLGDEYSTHEAAIEKAACLSRSIFSSIEKDYDRLVSVCSNETYDAGRSSSIKLASQYKREIASDFSIDPELVAARSIKTAASARPAMVTPDSQTEFLLDQYAAYKLAALTASGTNLTESTLFAAVLDS